MQRRRQPITILISDHAVPTLMTLMTGCTYHHQRMTEHGRQCGDDAAIARDAAQQKVLEQKGEKVRCQLSVPIIIIITKGQLS